MMYRLFATSTFVATAVAFLAGGCSGKESPAPSPAAAGGAKPVVVVIETSLGTFKAELWPDKAPKTVENFLVYVDSKHYDGTIFHRVEPRFVIQGGGFEPGMKQKDTLAPIRNEARSDTPNSRGTLAMARTGVVDSATCQFYVNLSDNFRLNHTGEDARSFGYCVFGKVLDDGMAVVDKISQVPAQDTVPVDPVIIKSIRRAD